MEDWVRWNHFHCQRLANPGSPYPSHLALVPVDTEDRIVHRRTQELFLIKLELYTSHTVLVVDNYVSMTTHDNNLQVAAYSSLAMEYIAGRLFKQTATNSNGVSLEEINRTAQVVLLRTFQLDFVQQTLGSQGFWKF